MRPGTRGVTADRNGSPKLVAIAYYVFGDVDRGRANINDYYQALVKNLRTKWQNQSGRTSTKFRKP